MGQLPTFQLTRMAGENHAISKAMEGQLRQSMNEFVGYSDESASSDNRFRTIGLLTGQRNALASLRDALADVLLTQGVNELKWVDIRTHRPNLQACNSFFDLVLKSVIEGNARIDVIAWDTHDTRHAVAGRDDTANFARMAWRLFRHAAQQWHITQWSFYPDEGSLLHTIELREVLNNTRLDKPGFSISLPLEMPCVEESAPFLEVAEVKPVDSKKEPLIQVADLFAGIVCYSRHKSTECIMWLHRRQCGAQQMLPWEWQEDLAAPNLADRNRFRVIERLYRLCKTNRLGVSLRGRGYLWTPSTTGPINFWHYEPQGDYDKAPTR